MLLLLCLFYTPAIAQKNEIDKSLEGKTFQIVFYEYSKDAGQKGVPIHDEITFINGKLYSKYMGKEYGFPSCNYAIEKNQLRNGKTVISFVSAGNNENNGQILYWEGKIADDTIEGIMNWFSKPMVKTFTGTLKYSGEER